MPLRRLYTLLFFLLLCAAAAHSRAGTYTFAGGTVDGCTLSGKIYACPGMPLPDWQDKVVIGGGYTVNVTGDVVFGFNQSLAMSGGATLKATGKIDIGGMSGSLLQVNGATFVATKAFLMGAVAQTVVADIRAASIVLGSSSVKVTGNVTSDTTLSLAFGSTVTGNIVAPTFTTDSGVTINGNVTATQAFTLGSGGVIAGDVVTGELTLVDSGATIKGNATVNHATLNWAGRVTDTIYCTGGTKPGQCDCVTNKSGWDIRKNKNSADGPYCEAKKQPAALDHFVIAHDQAASVCAPSSVTVTACANASCSTTYTAGTSVTLTPMNQAIAIGASGTATAAVMMPKVGSMTLGLSNAAAAQATTCRIAGGAASNCAVQVSDIGIALSVGPDNAFYASDSGDAQRRGTLTVKALRLDAQSQQCTALFPGASQTLDFTFARLNPGAGTLVPAIAGALLDKAPKSIALDFNDKGVATPSLSYADVGQLQLTAAYTDAAKGSSAKGSVTVVSAPASLNIVPAFTDKVAGSNFTAAVSALNASGSTAPGFASESPVVPVVLTAAVCHPAGSTTTGLPNPIPAPKAGGGAQSFTLLMSEAGSIDLKATVSNYLGAKLNDATGTTNKPVNGACTGAVGPFVPAYFQVAADPDWKRTTAPGGLPQYYSGEPAINLNLSARNRQGGVTVNYTKEVARDVRLDAIAVDAGGKETVAAAVTRSGAACASGGAGPVCAEEFSAGVAAKAGATVWKTGTITLPAKSAPFTAKIRATDAGKASSSAAPSELSVVVRVGRVRLSNIYGSAGKPLSMPVNVEYWTGTTWMRNTDHNDTVATFPATTFALPGLAGITASGVTIAKGAGALQLQPPAGSARASGAVVLNLGAGTAANLPCPGVTAATTPGANKAYLRAASCVGTAVYDPSSRASFGLNPPETRRIIHVREVFR